MPLDGQVEHACNMDGKACRSKVRSRLHPRGKSKASFQKKNGSSNLVLLQDYCGLPS